MRDRSRQGLTAGILKSIGKLGTDGQIGNSFFWKMWQLWPQCKERGSGYSSAPGIRNIPMELDLTVSPPPATGRPPALIGPCGVPTTPDALASRKPWFSTQEKLRKALKQNGS